MTHWRRSLLTPSPPFESSDTSEAVLDGSTMAFCFLFVLGVAGLFGTILVLLRLLCE